MDQVEEFGAVDKTGNTEEKDTALGATVNFLENTSAHGIGRTVTEKSITRRVFWGLAFSVAFIYCVIQTSTFVKMYLAFEVSVNVDIVHR